MSRPEGRKGSVPYGVVEAPGGQSSVTLDGVRPTLKPLVSRSRCYGNTGYFDVDGAPPPPSCITTRELLARGSVRKAVKRGQAAVAEVGHLLAQVNVSARLRDYGIPQDDIPRLVQEGMKFSRLFIPNPRNLTAQDVEKIYRDAW